MKKTLFLLFSLCTAIILNGQSINQFPYQENFDSGAGGWSGNGEWQLGSPINKTHINSAYSGLNAWITRLNGSYFNGASSSLISPVFDFSNRVPIVSFRTLFDSEFSYDGMRMEYSINNSSWQDLNSQNTSNWYNGSTGLLGSCWTGFIDNSQYLLMQRVVLEVAGQSNVRFRFWFRSDGSVTDDGFAIDNFRVDISRNDLEVLRIEEGYVNPPSSGCSVPPDSLILVVKNNLHTGVNNVPIGYTINGSNQTTSASFSGIETKRIYLPPPYSFQTNLNSIRAWTSLSGDVDRSNDTANFSVTVIGQVDLSLRRLLEPFDTNLKCIGNTQGLSVEVLNNSFIDISPLSISYRLNGTVITENISSNIPPSCNNGSFLYSFNQDIQFQGSGRYDLAIWVDHPLDNNSANDTLKTTLIYTENSQLPYLENFDSGSPVNGLGTDLMGVLPDGWEGFAVGVRNGPTGIADAGPQFDYSGNGNYITFLGNPGVTAELISPCIDIPNDTNDILLQLKYFYESSSFNFSRIEIIDANTLNRIGVPISPSTQSTSEDPFETLTASLNFFKGSTIYIRVFSGSFSGLFNIDDVRIYKRSATDLTVLSVNQPLRSECGSLSDSSLIVSIANAGQNAISSFDICYTINGASEHCENVSGGTFNVNDPPISYTFSKKVDLSTPQRYLFNVYTKLAADSNLMNDTVKSVFTNSNTTIPYNEEFDSTSVIDPSFSWESSQGLYRWEFTNSSTPSFNTGPLIDADDNPEGFYAYVESDPNDTAGSVAILNNEKCFDLSSSQTLVLEYDYHMYGSSINKLYLEVLGENDTIVFDSIVGEQQMSSSEDWKTRKLSLANISMSPAYFRFMAIKGQGEQGDISIDNFRVRDSLVSIREFSEAKEHFIVFPQPASDILSIVVKEKSIAFGSGQLNLMDLSGKEIISKNFEYRDNYQLNVGSIHNGIYLLRIVIGEKVYSKKIIIQK